MYTTLSQERLLHEIELLIEDIKEHDQEIAIQLGEIIKIQEELRERK